MFYKKTCNEKNKPLIKTPQEKKTKADLQHSINALDVAKKTLIKLVEKPDSNEPITFFLSELEKLIHGKSSAIFISSSSEPKFTLLTCTNAHDLTWLNLVPNSILPKHNPIKTTNKKIAIIENILPSDDKLVFIQLHNQSQNLSLLFIKLPADIKITHAIRLSLLEYSDHLTNILPSVNLARSKIRHKQYEERAVIARELHDSLAQSLSYLKIQTSRLQSILIGNNIQFHNNKSMEIDAMMQDLRSNLNISYRHLRELISTFRSTMGEKNFSQALTDSVEEFEKRSGIAFDIDNRLSENTLTVTEETQLLHIIREGLSNVVRHSQAKSALISIHYDSSGQVTTLIKDDGIGVTDISIPEQHFGIITMQERAHSIGGYIRLTEGENDGACLEIHFQTSKFTESILKL